VGVADKLSRKKRNKGLRVRRFRSMLAGEPAKLSGETARHLEG
jgi:hypothetical protein